MDSKESFDSSISGSNNVWKNSLSSGFKPVYTLDSIYKLCKKKKIEMPIIKLIYNIIYKNENPKDRR